MVHKKAPNAHTNTIARNHAQCDGPRGPLSLFQRAERLRFLCQREYNVNEETKWDYVQRFENIMKRKKNQDKLYLRDTRRAGENRTREATRKCRYNFERVLKSDAL